ncbi:MAG: hypothetical protein L0H70_05275 [Xanthomonadales bacterium]|nr:hypothetical protein [Xanthomonadales bacterium]
MAILALAWPAASALATTPAIGVDLIYANGFDMPTSGRGGANYLWYALGPNCAREDYGILPNYAEPGVRAQVQQQLAAMVNSGMRRLSIGIHFTDGWHTGTVIDASDAAKVSQVQANLATFLGDIEAAGYAEVLFRFFPQAALNPSSTTFNPSLMPEYWQLVQTLRVPLVNSGMPYLIDLMVEGAPPDSNSIFCYPDKAQCPSNPAWSNALRDLWRDYVAAYGASDSVGYSFLTASRTRERVRHMVYVYDVGGVPVYPSTFALDFYAYGGSSEADEFLDMHNLMGDYGHAAADWIISETYYNDPLAAAALSSAIAATQQTVAYLTQWPLDRAQTCADVSVPPPYQFDIWQMYGF